MSDSHTLALLRQVQWLYVLGAIIFLCILTAIYFWVGSLDFRASEHTTLRLLQSFVMAVATNMVPVFLFFVGSYFLLRHVQQIQSEHDREALTVAIAAAVRADLSESIRASGVHDVFRRFYTDVPWNQLLPGTAEFDLIVSYARTWKNTYREQLKQIAANPRARIRVVLANPENQALIEELSRRYGLSSGDVKSYAQESLADFTTLLGSGTAECHIRVSDRPCLYTYYRFDDVLILSLFPNTNVRTDRPGFVLRGDGTLSRFLRDEFETYFQASRVSTDIADKAPNTALQTDR
jgi:hypothetical protein